MNHDIQILRQCFSSFWKATFCVWAYRNEAMSLCDEVEKLRAETQAAKDASHLLELEVQHLKDKLSKEDTAHNKSRGYIRKLVTFIALRHRIDTPATNGTIRDMLQKSEGR